MSPHVVYIYQIVERDRDPLAIPPRPSPVSRAVMRRDQFPEWLGTYAARIGRCANTSRLFGWEGTGARTGRLLSSEKSPAIIQRRGVPIAYSARHAIPQYSP